MVLSSGQIGLPPIQTSPLGYAGSPINFVPVTSANRDPTTTDVNYATMTEWTNITTQVLWKLYGFIDGAANWQMIATGAAPGGGVTTLSDNSDVKVSPDVTGNIKLAAGTGISTVSTPGSNLITIAVTGSGTPATQFNVDAHTGPGTDPVVPDGSGSVTITGNQVAQGAVGANCIRTDSLAANSMTIEIQKADTSAAADANQNGVCHFDSTQFTVSAEGFVELKGGSSAPTLGIDVQTHTAPGTDPVIPNGSGNVVMQGTIVANQSIPIQTNSLAANTVNIETQYATTAAALDATKVGFAAFNSAQFTDGGSGFISLVGGPTPPTLGLDVDAHTAPGTDPVQPNGSGNIALTGAQVAAGTVGTNVIRTDSLAANSCTIEIQRSTNNATTDASKNGVSHFKSTDFNVDANGFVSLVSPGGSLVVQQARATSTTSVSTTKVCPVTGTTPTTANTDAIISITMTPTSATNILEFEFSSPFGMDNDGAAGFFLFQGSTLLACFPVLLALSTTGATATFLYYKVSGTTSSTTYTVRAAVPGGGTSTLRTLQNGFGTALYNGVGNTTTVFTISEYTP